MYTARGKPLYCCQFFSSTNQSVNQSANKPANYPSINKPSIDQSIKQSKFFNNKKLFPYDTREIFISLTRDHNQKYVTINHENRCPKQKRLFPQYSEFLLHDLKNVDKRFARQCLLSFFRKPVKFTIRYEKNLKRNCLRIKLFLVANYKITFIQTRNQERFH